MIETNQNPAKILEPSVRSLDFPPAAIASKFTPILNFDFPVRTLRANQIDFSLRLQSVTKLVSVGCSVIDQARKSLARSFFAFAWNPNRVKRTFYQRRFIGRRGSELKADRHALTIYHHHKLCFFPTVSVSPTLSPFFRMNMFHPRRFSPTGVVILHLRLCADAVGWPQGGQEKRDRARIRMCGQDLFPGCSLSCPVHRPGRCLPQKFQRRPTLPRWVVWRQFKRTS
jgi:hypothetical protein